MKEITIKQLKKQDEFYFNDKKYKVKQKFADWKKNNEPYMLTTDGQYWWYDELEVEIL